MPKSDMIEMEGTVTEALPGLKFNVEVDVGGTKKTLVCVPSGKIKTHYVRILVGDKVAIDVSPYDLTKGRITWRFK